MEEILVKALDYGLSLGASYVEVRWQRDSGSAAGLRNGQFEFAVSYSSRGVAVRSVAGGGLGFAAAPSMKLEDVFGAVERAVKLAKCRGEGAEEPGGA